MNYKTVTLKSNKNFNEIQKEITKDIWNPIMLNSKIAEKCWPKLEKYFPEYQLFLLSDNDDVIGFANTIPFFWDKKLELLPDEGWDWLIQKGISDYENNINPNCLGGLQIGISKKYQGQGHSKKIINLAKELSKKNNYSYFIIPIRPTYKYKYPLIEMEKYINWTKDKKIYDPWIRTHRNCGAEVIKICKKSMTFTGSIKEWEKWSGLDLIESGQYIIEGTLNPVKIDIEKNYGIYYDENLWIFYQ